MADDKPLILVDGSSYLFRAFHALPPLTTSEGPHGCRSRSRSMLRKLMSDYPGSDVVVVFDAKGDTFRNELYPEYKNRPPMPEELRAQIELLHALVDAMGLPRLVISGSRVTTSSARSRSRKRLSARFSSRPPTRISPSSSPTASRS